MASGMKTPLERDEIESLLEWMNEKPGISSSAFHRIPSLFSAIGCIIISSAD